MIEQQKYKILKGSLDTRTCLSNIQVAIARGVIEQTATCI